jgi:acetyltransferase-like isoleucine patch superfamily enzyme
LSLKKVIEYQSSEAQILVGSSLRVSLAKGAKIIVHKGQIRFAFHLSDDQMFSTKNTTCLCMEENSTLIFKGDAHIAPGATIRIKKGGILEVGDKCVLAHDAFVYCSRKIIIGNDVSVSWNVTLVDDDQHHYYKLDKGGARPLRRIYKPLVIEDFAGIQMNVVVPHGQTIGSGAIIAANTVLRQDVPAQSLVYIQNDLKVKANVAAPVQFLRS